MKIESLDQACQVKGFGNAADIMPDFSMYPEKHRAALQAVAELILIADASREKDPNWNDMDEQKYAPVADLEVDKNNPDGFRFDRAGSWRAYAYAGLGSRLCYESDEDTEYHFEQHKDRYKAVLTIAK